MVAFLGLYGAHASGKTTAITELWERIEGGALTFNPGVRLTIIFGDNSNAQHCYDDGKVHVIPRTKGRSPWKDKAEGKRALVADCIADDTRLWLVESARFDTHFGIADAHFEYDGGAKVVFTVTSWETMRGFLIARCADRNKEFRADYWTPTKLNYEGYNRYINQARKYLDPVGVPYTRFEIGPTREEWAQVMGHIEDLINIPMEEWYDD